MRGALPWSAGSAVFPVLRCMNYKRRWTGEIFQLNLALLAGSALSIVRGSCKPFFAGGAGMTAQKPSVTFSVGSEACRTS